MWTIVSLDIEVPGAQAHMSDGQPVVWVQRGGVGASTRLMITGIGYLDIIDCGAPPGNPQPDALNVSGPTYWYTGQANLTLVVNSEGMCTVSGDGNGFSEPLVPFPTIDPGDIDMMGQMVSMGLVPYPTLPTDGRPFKDVEPTAFAYFAWTPNAPALGLSIYDWTTADFFRMDVFNYYRYTSLPGAPLDENDIVNAIWTTSWPPYVASDADFMHSMLMTPAISEADVANQYQAVSAKLAMMLEALKRIVTAGLQAMPRTSTLAIPELYSGQVDVSNLGPSAFATYFLEYPGNAGPVGTPMGEPLAQALTGFMAPGQTVTLKSFMSTTNSQSGAIQYSNGILLQITQAVGVAPFWQTCAYITPLSNEATKTEYLFQPGSQFLLGQSFQQTVGTQTITVIPMTALWIRL